MDFFRGQETLSILDWILRAVAAFLFLVLVAKLIGQRSISQLRLIDFVIALVIGNIIAHPLSDEKLGLEGSVITTLVLVALYLGVVYAMLKYPKFRRLLNSKPIMLVQNGQILSKGLRKARISIDILLEELREGKVKDISNVAMAFLEADGRISFFLHPKYECATNEALNIKTEPFDMPAIIIKEGIINTEELKRKDKGEDWVVSKIRSMYNTEVHNVLLATLDSKGTLNVILYR